MELTIEMPDKGQIKQASNIALASLLNLTLLPVFSFIYVLVVYGKTEPQTLARYHALLAIKINVIAAIALFVVSALMIFFGGFDSPWTWVYVITYFTLVHSIFILFAVWALIRAWSGDTLKKRKHRF